jgi:predicted hydrolase (HD superfamily)
MSSDYFNDPKHWLARAAEMREIARTIVEDGIKESMLKLANDYDKLAARAIARGTKEASAGP